MNHWILGCITFLLLLRPAESWAAHEQFGFRYIETNNRQIRITSVDPKGLAGQIGLRQDDVLKKINGIDITSTQSLDRALRQAIDERKYEIMVYRPRDKGERTLKGQVRESKPGSYYIIRRD